MTKIEEEDLVGDGVLRRQGVVAALASGSGECQREGSRRRCKYPIVVSSLAQIKGFFMSSHAMFVFTLGRHRIALLLVSLLMEAPGGSPWTGA
jgi:hypothetical protein